MKPKTIKVTLELFRNEGTNNYNWRLKRTHIVCNSGEPNGFNSESRMLTTLRNSVFPFHTWVTKTATEYAKSAGKYSSLHLEHNGMIQIIKVVYPY